MMTVQSNVKQLIHLYLGFWLGWALLQVLVLQPASQHLASWPAEVITDGTKLSCWLGFAIWYWHRNPATLSIPNRQQWQRPQQWRLTIGLVTLLVTYLVAQSWLRHHGLVVNPHFQLALLGQDFLIVGVTEEAVFRGVFLNRLRAMTSPLRANGLQALLFALIHVPRYLLTLPPLPWQTWVSNLTTVFLLGWLFGWLFLKTRSLWPSIIVHMCWDLLVTVLALA